MKVVFIIWHIVLFLESFLLIRKRVLKRGTLLGLLNLGMSIYHIFFFKNISNTILDVKNMFHLHFGQGLLFLILNIMFMGFVWYLLKYAIKRKKQNKIIYYSLMMIGGILILYFLILLFQSRVAFVYFGLFLLSLYFLIKCFVKTSKTMFVGIFLLTLVLGSYSFFTYTGAARLSLALEGYVKEAYETGLEELNFLEEKNMKKYAPIQNIDEKINIVRVQKYGPLKVGFLD